MKDGEMSKVMKIEVRRCHDALLWYSKHLNEKFDVIWFDPEEHVFWVREKDDYKAKNWVACKDAEVIE
jgi:hypothetical protein